MSITIDYADMDGLVLKSSISALGFPEGVAKAIHENYKELIGGMPLATQIKTTVVDGRVSPLAQLLGLPQDSTEVESTVYSLGTIDFCGNPEEIHLWVSTFEGVMHFSYCSTGAIEYAQSHANTLSGYMDSFSFPEGDLDDVLALLGTDLTDPANHVGAVFEGSPTIH